MWSRKFCFLFLIFLGLFSYVAGVDVAVGIETELGGEVEYLDMKKNLSGGVQRFRLQWYNTKSVSCKSQMEFIVKNETHQVSRVWSNKKKVMAGESRAFEGYFLPEKKGMYNASVRIHNCFDTEEIYIGKFMVEKAPESIEGIDLRVENLPDSTLGVEISAEKNVSDVVVVPSKDYPGLIIEPLKVDEIEEGETVEKEIDYVPSVWIERNVSLKAVSMDGKYSSNTDRASIRNERSFEERYGKVIAVVVIIILTVSNIILLLNTQTKIISQMMGR